eukprot:Pompholyxophrys_punicea_v1_NODE_21_length_5692_cov_19.735675.p4 type:complete len:151 gc:universal NODE_21_length_5692_cov_19.735675:4398-4850(+)
MDLILRSHRLRHLASWYPNVCSSSCRIPLFRIRRLGPLPRGPSVWIVGAFQRRRHRVERSGGQRLRRLRRRLPAALPPLPNDDGKDFLSHHHHPLAVDTALIDLVKFFIMARLSVFGCGPGRGRDGVNPEHLGANRHCELCCTRTNQMDR